MRLCHNRKQRGEAVGFQNFRMRVHRLSPLSKRMFFSYCDTFSMPAGPALGLLIVRDRGRQAGGDG